MTDQVCPDCGHDERRRPVLQHFRQRLGRTGGVIQCAFDDGHAVTGWGDSCRCRHPFHTVQEGEPDGS